MQKKQVALNTLKGPLRRPEGWYKTVERRLAPPQLGTCSAGDATLHMWRHLPYTTLKAARV